jgi:arylsulfatase
MVILMKKKNLLFITTDQQRQDSLPCYGLEFMKTPSLDWIADNGMVFNNCYVTAPVCGPSRSAMMCGQYPSVVGTLSNDTNLPHGTPVWPEIVGREGYQTAAIGKMHFTPWDQLGGFKERIICEDKRHFYLPDDHYTFLKHNGLDRSSPVEFPEYHESLGAPYFIHEKKFHPDVFVAESAAQWLETNGDEPFAVWVSFPSPHDPYDPPAEMKDMYEECQIPEPIQGSVEANYMLEEQLAFCRDTENNSVFRIDPTKATPEQIRRWRKHYYATISLIDEGIGKMIDVLREKGVLEDTYIVFTSDHGDALGDHGLSYKYFFYESMVKVPLLVYGPGVSKGSTCDSLVSTVNLMPMFLDICQAPKPKTVQGKSLMELIETPEKPINNHVFSEFLGRSMVYDGRYKYVHYISGGEELFDVQEDPQEITNRSKDDSLFHIKSDLKSKLIEHMLECQSLLKQRTTVETHPERKRIDDEYKQMRISIKN